MYSERGQKMQLLVAHLSEQRVTVRTGRSEARRLVAALFLFTVAPLLAWSVASAQVRQGQDRPAPSAQAISESGHPAQPLMIAANIARAPSIQSVTATAARRQTTVRTASQPAAPRRAKVPSRVVVNARSAEIGVIEPAPALMAQAAAQQPAPEAAPGFETGSALTRPETPQDSTTSTQQELTPASDPFAPLAPARPSQQQLTPDPASTSPGGVVLAPGLDVNQLRTAPQSRRLRSAMHRVAASTAASLSSQNAFGSALDRERFESAGAPGATAVVDRSMGQAAEAVEVIPGLRLENVVLSAGYSNNGIPGSRFRGFNTNVGPDYDMGARATFSYRKAGRSSTLNFNYRPSHIRRSRLSEWNTTNHNLMLTTTKDLGRRWTVGGGMMGMESGVEQALITPAVLSTLNNAPGTFTDLINQVETGTLTDDQFASALTGTPVVDEPARRRLSLARGMVLTGISNVSYRYSPRLTFSMQGRMSRFDVRQSDLQANETRTGLFFSGANSSGVSATARYRVSARRNVGVTQSMNFRGANPLVDGSAASATQFIFEDKLTRSWTYSFRAGLGSVGSRGLLLTDPNDPTSTVIDPATGANQFVSRRRNTWVASGQLGYMFGNQRLFFTAARRVGDTFNFGNNAAISGMAGWGWTPRRSAWSFNASGSYYQANGRSVLNGVRGFQSRFFSTGFSRALTPSTAFRTDFNFGYFHTPYSGLFANNSIRRVQMSFVWRPDTSER